MEPTPRMPFDSNAALTDIYKTSDPLASPLAYAVGWPIHRWHHAPTELYWLASVRANFPQIVLANISYLLAFPLLKPAPAAFFSLYS